MKSGLDSAVRPEVGGTSHNKAVGARARQQKANGSSTIRPVARAVPHRFAGCEHRQGEVLARVTAHRRREC